MSVMFNFAKNFEDQNFIINCLSSGICTLDPTLGALEELLLNEVRQISFYLVRAREFGYENPEIMAEAVKALSIDLLNTNFCEKEYLEVLEKLIEQKKEVKKNYLNICENSPMGCVLISFMENISAKSSINKLIKEGEKSLRTSYSFFHQEKIGLFKLIILISKMSAKNIQRIKSFEPGFTEYDFEILRIFSLKNLPATRVEKLKRRLLEFSQISYKIEQKLISVLKKHYMERESTEVLLSAKAGKSILVSGTDLKQLENLLIAIGDREINVYTHNSLLAAHTFPKLRKYKNLIGHWGGANTHQDFSNFKGVIYLTKNSKQKIDNLYRGLIYSSEEVNARGVIKVIGDDYEPLIEATLSHAGFEEDEPEEILKLEYNETKISELLESEKEVVVFFGNSKDADYSSLIGNKLIINLQYPMEYDLLHNIVKKIHEKEITTIIFFTRCEPQIICTALSIVALGIKEIYLSKCPIAIVSPQIMDSLEKDFGIKIIG